MATFLLIAKAEHLDLAARSSTAFEEVIEAVSENDAVRKFWANAANILERRRLPLHTTRISLSSTEIIQPSDN